MRYHALMVRRIHPADLISVAQVFADHDATGLPEQLGVRQRTLLHFNGLYMHLVQSDVDFLPRLYEARNEPLIRDIDGKLRGLLRPYHRDQPTMRESRAVPFYNWMADR